jgi:putative pyruvate formate lyase activating enzyme
VPNYVRLYESGELERRVEAALASLEQCRVCPWDCEINRLQNEKKVCRTGRYARVASYFPHFGEEDCLRGWQGSGTIFFAWCNLRCVFCCHPDTFISTDRGVMCIADIFERGGGELPWHGGEVRLGDGSVRVVTREGKLAKVTKMFRHWFTGGLVKIKPFNCPPLLLTPNHNVFVMSKRVPDQIVKMPAAELTGDHYLLVPKEVIVGADTTPDIAAVLSSSRWPETEHWYLVPMHKIERMPYDGPVFNLEVDDPDHSYLASFVAVSNCQNYDISQQEAGVEVRPEQLAEMMLELQAMGCHNINWVTPEHVVPQILEALPYAIRSGLRLPLVYNTSAFDSLDSLRHTDGIVDIYMPDFKYWYPEKAKHYLKSPKYPEAARAALKEMHRQVGNLTFDERGLARRGVLVRHLVMPDALDDTRQIMRFLATELSPQTYVNIMDQYYPAGKVSEEKYPELCRRPMRHEVREAFAMARDAGLCRFDERWLASQNFRR